MKKDIAWGYASQFLQYGAALLILPVLLRKLSSAEMGIWYVLLTISTFAVMLDMGFTPTLARNVSYVLGGAKSLFREGHDVGGDDRDVDYGLLKKVIQASRKIFLCLSVLALVLMSTLGTYFILHVAHGQIPLREVIISWALFVAATVLNLYFKYYTPLLQGRGLFAEYYRATAISNLGFVLTTAVLLYAGWGVIGVSAGFFVSALLGRWLSGWYLFDAKFSAELRGASENATPAREIIATLWENAWRLGLVVISAFFTLKANTLVASAYLGLAETARYALTIQVFSTLSSVSIVAVTIQQQKMARHRVAGDHKALKTLVEIGLASAMLFYLVGAIPVVLFGNRLIALVGGHTQMMSQTLLCCVAVMLFLELNHSVSSSIITTRNVVPFTKPSLLSAAGVFMGSIIGLHFFHFGVWWLVATQAVTQAVYNNWRWPHVLAKEFHTTYPRLIAEGVGAFAKQVRVMASLLVAKKRAPGS